VCNPPLHSDVLSLHTVLVNAWIAHQRDKTKRIRKRTRGSRRGKKEKGRRKKQGA
jgi:hypothetical protein